MRVIKAAGKWEILCFGLTSLFYCKRTKHLYLSHSRMVSRVCFPAPWPWGWPCDFLRPVGLQQTGYDQKLVLLCSGDLPGGLWSFSLGLKKPNTFRDNLNWSSSQSADQTEPTCAWSRAPQSNVIQVTRDPKCDDRRQRDRRGWGERERRKNIKEIGE